MPKLKQLDCSLQIGPSDTPLKEYGAQYRDGYVETFIPVPDTDLPFTISLKTDGYIAPGLGVWVFMDGQYQCNKNKMGFKMPGRGVEPRDNETTFHLRQKEDKTSTPNNFVVRDWTFAKLNRGDCHECFMMAI